MMLNKMVCDSFRPEQRYSYRFRVVTTLCRGAELAAPDCSSPVKDTDADSGFVREY